VAVEDDLDLSLAISVCQATERRGMIQPQVLKSDYEGWVFSFDHYILTYQDGELTRDDGLVYEILHFSIGELIEWDILTPIAGNFCPLLVRECPECQYVTYWSNDYICWKCRSSR
jgi:hypothetical protein